MNEIDKLLEVMRRLRDHWKWLPVGCPGGAWSLAWSCGTHRGWNQASIETYFLRQKIFGIAFVVPSYRLIRLMS